MKVLFITRATLFTNRGGDTIQVLNTSKYLKRLNVETEIKLCNENIDYHPYHLIHFFNIVRPSDIMVHIRKSGKPYVISTIYVDYSGYDKNVRQGFSGFLFRLLPASFNEYLKVIGRAVFNHEKIVSKEYLWRGQDGSIKKIIQGAALLLPNSQNEYRRLVQHYGMEQSYKVIPNAIDPEIFNENKSGIQRDPGVVLCVGRIEGLKNQLNLIKALNDTKYQLFIIGSPATNQQNYYNQCKEVAGRNIHFIEDLPHHDLVAHYKKAKVHVLPSWFETTGLSSLEAAAMGCSIVITSRGDTKEYFGEMAFYCDPSSPESIKKAVDKAANTLCNEMLVRKVRTQYTWTVSAEKTLEAYHVALSTKKNL